MALVPRVSNDPIELFTDYGLVKPPFYTKYWGVCLYTLSAIGTVVAYNFFERRPIYSGIRRPWLQLQVVYLIWLGNRRTNKRNGILALADAQFRHYIQLHPDDFPIVDTPKYADVLEQWVPIR